MSDDAEVVSCVPHGTVMGPLLFLVFINDLPESVNSSVKLFADDCLLYRPIRSTSDSTKLREDLDKLEKWENDWQMAFHPQNAPPSISARNANPPYAITICMAIPLKASQAGNTLAYTSARTCLGVSTSTRPQPKPPDLLDSCEETSDVVLRK